MAAHETTGDPASSSSSVWKHSSGDLQSRLKTRKILGVGETDNGDIHRSKISQVLGHNEHLYVRLPRGLWVTHVGLAVLVTLECALLLLAPSTAGALGLAPLGGPQCPLTPLRLVGAALSGLAVFVWTAVGTTDKQCARTALVATVLYNALSVAIAVATAAVEGELWAGAATPMAGCRVLVCCLCLAYFRQIGEPGCGHPRATSYKDLTSGDAARNNAPSSREVKTPATNERPCSSTSVPPPPPSSSSSFSSSSLTLGGVSGAAQPPHVTLATTKPWPPHPAAASPGFRHLPRRIHVHTAAGFH